MRIQTQQHFSVHALAKSGDNQITTQHEVHIDDISLEEVKDDPKDDIKDNQKTTRKMTSRTIQRTT